MMWWLIFGVTFLIMEFVAAFMHRFVMHGFLWCLHEDHHVIDRTRWWQRNDAFALFFATPSFFSILFDAIWDLPWLGAIGFGIMAYGAVYFFVHEVMIHRRLKIQGLNRGWYFKGLQKAHRVHHSVRTKEGATCFGMLIVPLQYFRNS